MDRSPDMELFGKVPEGSYSRAFSRDPPYVQPPSHDDEIGLFTGLGDEGDEIQKMQSFPDQGVGLMSITQDRDELDLVDDSDEGFLSSADEGKALSVSDGEVRNDADVLFDILPDDEDEVTALLGAWITPSQLSLLSDDETSLPLASQQPAQSSLQPDSHVLLQHQGHGPVPVPASSHVAAKLESILLEVANDLQRASSQLVITLPSPRSTAALTSSTARAQREKTFCFPGKDTKEAWRFTVVLRILELMHEALIAQTVATKRDPALFGSQAVVDRHVDTIATCLQIPRSQLNVCAAAKGLIAGALSILKRDGSVLDVSACSDAVLIMQLDEILSLHVEHTEWILIVEKEATFQSIISSAFWTLHSDHGIIITAKGYPDVATRALLNRLTTPSSLNGWCEPQVFGLVDFDPDGIGILSTYKHGSIAMRDGNQTLKAPNLQRIGLSSAHIDPATTHQIQGLLPLTSRDRKRATSMLSGYEILDHNGAEPSWRADLQFMLMLNVKAELQILDAVTGGLPHVLEDGLPLKWDE